MKKKLTITVVLAIILIVLVTIIAIQYTQRDERVYVHGNASESDKNVSGGIESL